MIRKTTVIGSIIMSTERGTNHRLISCGLSNSSRCTKQLLRRTHERSQLKRQMQETY